MTRACALAVTEALDNLALRGVLLESRAIAVETLASLDRQMAECQRRLAEAREQAAAAGDVFETEAAMFPAREVRS